MIESELLRILAAVLSIGIPGVGSAYAMQRIGELSESLLEKEEKGFFTNSLIFSVLAETPAIYGLLVGLIVLVSSGSFAEAQGIVAVLASIAVAIPGAAAAYAIGLVSQAALVAVKENRRLFGKSLIFAALPEAIAIYGLIVALLFLNGVGIIGTGTTPSIVNVEKVALATLVTALSGLVAIFIGRVAVSGIKSLAKDEGTFGQSLIIAVLPESIALYILITVLLILTNSGFI
ncbi:MAG: hypothetical protein D6769_01710 [Methanobacteriota archaeon]|nr:MAG: hypothetical protein D6769_01710 [Euryarchaeota archaeon]